MAKDINGNEVKIGDYIAIDSSAVHPEASPIGGTIARIVKLSESVKETRAVGAYVDLAGNGRVARSTFDPTRSHLIMRHSGEYGPGIPQPTASRAAAEAVPIAADGMAPKPATEAKSEGGAATSTRKRTA